MAIQKVRILPFQVSTANETVSTNCNDITFVNTAAIGSGITVTINGFPLIAGSSITLGGNKDEQITNGLVVITPAANVGVCWYWRKNYQS